MKYHFKIYKEETGFWAECVELQGCQTQGNDIKELKFNMEEALNVYLDEPVDSNIEIVFPKENIKGKNITEIAVLPQIAFALLIRYYRNKKQLSQEEVKELLEMKNLFSYQRLERKTDPKLSTLAKVKKVFPEISIDYILDV